MLAIPPALMYALMALGGVYTGGQVAQQFWETPKEKKFAERQQQSEANQLQVALMSLLQEGQDKARRQVSQEKMMGRMERMAEADRMTAADDRLIASSAAMSSARGQDQIARAMSMYQALSAQRPMGVGADMQMLASRAQPSLYELAGLA